MSGTVITATGLAGLTAQPADPVLGLMAAFRADPRSDKLDLGAGLYRDASGRTPVLASIRQAEAMLHASQTSKGYLAPEGDGVFTALTARMILGENVDYSRMAAIQTPGGSGALRVAGDLLAGANPKCAIHVGTPTWPNYRSLLPAGDSRLAFYRAFDAGTQTLLIQACLDAVAGARPGDAIVLQAGCHNPTGADFSLEQWRMLADAMAARDLVPLLDMAYHGLANGLEMDAAGVRIVVQTCPVTLLAYSCDKNFGLYRERVGALYAFGSSAAHAAVIASNMVASVLSTWSMPPDHGAALVRIILESAELATMWHSEVAAMQARLRSLRETLARQSELLSFVREQNGLFGLLPFSPDDIAELREQHGIYMPSSARFNVAGLDERGMKIFVDATLPKLRRISQDGTDVT